MKILIDEGLAPRLGIALAGALDSEVWTVRDLRLNGKATSDAGLLTRMAAMRIDVDVVVTNDRGFASSSVGVVYVRSRRLPRLLDRLPIIVEAIRRIRPGQLIDTEADAN